MYLFDPDSTEFSFSNSGFEEMVKVGIVAIIKLILCLIKPSLAFLKLEPNAVFAHRWRGLICVLFVFLHGNIRERHLSHLQQMLCSIGFNQTFFFHVAFGV